MPTYPGNGITFPYVWADDIRGAGAAFPVVGLILLVLRLQARLIQKTRFGLDDYFSILSWLFILGMGADFIYGANNGALGHRTPKDHAQLTKTYISHYQKLVLQLEYAFLIMMILALGCTKLSILFFFRRLFIAHKRTVLDWITRVLTGIVCLWTVAFFLAFTLECGGKPSAFWDPLSVRVRYCMAINGGIAQLERACGISDLVLDVLCLSLPFPIIWRVNLRLSYKLSITGIFMVGLMTIAASVARLVIWVQVLATAANPKEDANLAVALSLHWGMIETGLAFFASQLPALSTYLKEASRDKILGSLRNAVSWVSLRSISSPNRSHEDVANSGNFQPLDENTDKKRQEDLEAHGNSQAPRSSASHHTFMGFKKT